MRRSCYCCYCYYKFHFELTLVQLLEACVLLQRSSAELFCFDLVVVATLCCCYCFSLHLPAHFYIIHLLFYRLQLSRCFCATRLHISSADRHIDPATQFPSQCLAISTVRRGRGGGAHVSVSVSVECKNDASNNTNAM